MSNIDEGLIESRLELISRQNPKERRQRQLLLDYILTKDRLDELKNGDQRILLMG